MSSSSKRPPLGSCTRSRCLTTALGSGQIGDRPCLRCRILQPVGAMCFPATSGSRPVSQQNCLCRDTTKRQSSRNTIACCGTRAPKATCWMRLRRLKLSGQTAPLRPAIMTSLPQLWTGTWTTSIWKWSSLKRRGRPPASRIARPGPKTSSTTSPSAAGSAIAPCHGMHTRQFCRPRCMAGRARPVPSSLGPVTFSYKTRCPSRTTAPWIPSRWWGSPLGRCCGWSWRRMGFGECNYHV
mmetsp:Transcript_25600/g.66442  ORF Transcript_25600/g.66442 Transcript_25600/m.66442 type:complete len:239 (-) Transcript_25600:1567-2283(-)